MSSRILEITDHRPWPVPRGPWVMSQHWHDLLFAHWPVDVKVMRRLVPDELELDIYDGRAWVGVVPFRMSHIRPRFCPAVPWLSHFLEFNIRTYVKSRNESESKPGVYFFSLDAANPIAVSLARSTFKLPYFNAEMSLEQVDETTYHYTSQRTHRGAREGGFRGQYGPCGQVSLAQPGTINHWFTERYCLYTVWKGNVFRGEIHHQPWPLQPAWAEWDINTIAQASDLELIGNDPILSFSKTIEVVVWPIQKVTT